MDLVKLRISGYSHHTFEKLNDESKKEVLQRLNLIKEEYEVRSSRTIFSSAYLDYDAGISNLLNSLINIKEDSIYTIIHLLFQKIRDTKGADEKYNTAATAFFELIERLGFKYDFADLEDTKLFEELLYRGENSPNTETLNWEFTRIRAEYVYGINLGEFYDAYNSLSNLEFLLTFFKQQLFSDNSKKTYVNQNNVQKELEELDNELEDLQELWRARYGLNAGDIITRKGISLISQITPETVENASMMGELKAIKTIKKSKKKDKKIEVKNLEFSAEEAIKWLTHKKRQNRKKRYYPTLFDEDGHILALPIKDKNDLDEFLDKGFGGSYKRG